MLAQGSPLSTIEELSIEDMRLVYTGLRLGFVGPLGEYRQTYYQLAKQNEIAEILRATALGKRFKATPFAKFHELFPDIDDIQTLGTGAELRKIQKQQSMAVKAAAGLGGNMPAWIKNELQ